MPFQLQFLFNQMGFPSSVSWYFRVRIFTERTHRSTIAQNEVHWSALKVLKAEG